MGVGQGRWLGWGVSVVAEEEARDVRACRHIKEEHPQLCIIIKHQISVLCAYFFNLLLLRGRRRRVRKGGGGQR